MIASNFINPNIPSLKPTDSSQRALDFMEEFKLYHLPVVYKEQYLGIISETALLNDYDTSGPVSNYKLDFQNVSLSPMHYIYDITHVLVHNKLSIVPIINSQESFEGVVTVEDVLKGYGKWSASRSPGTVFEILLKSNDYSLGEIARIIESNGARLLSSFIRTYNDDPTQLLLSIKLDKENVPSVFAALERHEYNIVGKFGKTDERDEDIDRLQHLFKYLNT